MYISVYNTESYLEHSTSFPQTTFPPAVGSINLHPTVDQFNKLNSINLNEIKTVDQFNKLNSINVNDVEMLRLRNLSEATQSDTRNQKWLGLCFKYTERVQRERSNQIFSVSAKCLYQSTRSRPLRMLMEKFNFDVEAIKLHDQALLELKPYNNKSLAWLQVRMFSTILYVKYFASCY